MLRKVIDRVWADGKDFRGNGVRILKDKLECGHLVTAPADIFGRQTTRQKRRCQACIGLKRQMRPEVEPS